MAVGQQCNNNNNNNKNKKRRKKKKQRLIIQKKDNNKTELTSQLDGDDDGDDDDDVMTTTTIDTSTTISTTAMKSNNNNNSKNKKKKRKRNNNATATTVDNKDTTTTTTTTINEKDDRKTNKKKQKLSICTTKNNSNISNSSNNNNNNNNNNNSLSLASKLKRQRGTAETTPLPPPWNPPTRQYKQQKQNNNNNYNNNKLYLEPKDGLIFNDCKEKCYKGFIWEEPNKLSKKEFHDKFNNAFDTLYNNGLFLYDSVQAGSKQRISKTFVTRTLIGNPGSTYRYLGLRLFSHPWSYCNSNNDNDDHDSIDNDDEINDDDSSTTITENDNIKSLIKIGYKKSVAISLIEIGKLNKILTKRTEQILKNEIVPTLKITKTTTTNNNEVLLQPVVGSAKYNLTLINRMEPSNIKKKLKFERIYGLGKTSVSWHKDSGLMDFSSIAVYHSLRNNNNNNENNGNYNNNDNNNNDNNNDEHWRVALRVATDNNNNNKNNSTPSPPPQPPPPLSVPLPNGSLYYLLDDFNHKHEHAVIAGSYQLRYSSTHRVAREGVGTWQYINNKCKHIIKEKNSFSFSNSNSTTTCSSHNNNNNNNKRKKISRKKLKQIIVKETRIQQNLLNEIEFDWLRQWYVQGKLHSDLHPYWHKPINKLCNYYVTLETLGIQIINILEKEAMKQNDNDNDSTQLQQQQQQKQKQNQQTDSSSSSIVSEDLYDVMIETLEERNKIRKTWHDRYKDPLYKSLPLNEQPMSCPILDRSKKEKTIIDLKETTTTTTTTTTTLKANKKKQQQQQKIPEDLKSLILKIRNWRSLYVDQKELHSNNRNNNNNGNTTKSGDVNSSTSSSGSNKKKSGDEGCNVKKSNNIYNKKRSNLTKKEKKKIASNWEMMKSSISK